MSTAGRRVACHDHDAGRRWATHFADVMQRGREHLAFAPLDKSKIPNLKYLDPKRRRLPVSGILTPTLASSIATYRAPDYRYTRTGMSAT